MAKQQKEFTSKQRFSFSDDVIFEYTDDEAVILNLITEDIFSLNETGTHIARLVSAKSTFEEICQTVEEHYAYDKELLEREVSILLTELMAKNLIRTIEKPSQND